MDVFPLAEAELSPEDEKKRFQEAVVERRDEIEEQALDSLSATLATLEETRRGIQDPELLIKLGKFLLETSTINGKGKQDENDRLPTVVININRSSKPAVSAAKDLIEDITPIELNPTALMCAFDQINNELALELDA